ncbi:endonuclease/exonuclease/phosphatase family protein [Promicromonospora sp. NPDC057138]|uniref:endonuclease/exonuclease/phosphatase family protein n=1 Tax=Promicromonospora sp. NPDC057138 TaxID=3346031 RepID=UPI00363E47FF
MMRHHPIGRAAASRPGASAAGAIGALSASAALAGPAAARTALSTSAGAPVIGPARGGLVHAMSFNIRYDQVGQTHPGEPDYWPERAPLTTEFLRLEQPTILGVQEVLFHQLSAVQEGLGQHYEMVGFGREGGAGGEYSSIFYDARRLTLKWWDQFWLSDTPKLIGSATWGNTVTRIVTWAQFQDSATGRDFLHINSHFDHQAENAQVRSALVVRDQIAEAGLPVVFTADCNAPAEASAPYDVLVTEGGLQDSWLAADRQLTPHVDTFPDYGTPSPDGTRIDWILATPGIEVRAAAINTWTRDGRYPSDHTPIQALLKI